MSTDLHTTRPTSRVPPLYVIGDIHGRCAQLHSLLDLLPRDESVDTLVFLGDLIDRGPDVPGCVLAGFTKVGTRRERSRGSVRRVLSGVPHEARADSGSGVALHGPDDESG